MARSTTRSFDAPNEHRQFELGVLDLITVGALTLGRESLEPGWRWSTHVMPIDGTERCEFRHVGYQVSGRWICEDRDGTQIEIGPGDVYDTPPGHDAWVIGDEVCVCIDFQGMAGWAAGRAPVLTTILFADIVDSTALIDRIGDAAWRSLQSQFFENVHSVLASQDGLLVNTAGDGILARFQSPAGAVHAASALVTDARRLEFELRAGVHTGDVVEQANGDLTGMAVHVGARVMATAGPGEVFVTSTTRDLTLDAGLEYEDRGSVKLKGVPGLRSLYALST